VWIELSVQRLYCRSCGRTRQAELAFAEPRHSYTRQFERFVLELSQHTTIQDAARHLGVGWDLIKEIQKQNLQRRFARMPP
jgi:transposase